MKLFLVLCFVAAAAAAVAEPQSLQPTPAPLTISAAAGVSYDKNGSDWTGLCASGKHQSPINIVNAEMTAILEPEAPYSSRAPYHVETNHYSKVFKKQVRNTGLAIEVDLSEGGYVSSGCANARYDARRIVFHAPAEHTIDGKRADVEAQIVHQKAGSTGNNDLLIVSILFHQDVVPNDFLKSLNWFSLPTEKGKTIDVDEVDVNKLSDALGSDYWAYDGSLTTPGCDETVAWRIMEASQPISQDQIDRISRAFAKNNDFAVGNGNNRLPQARNDRAVVLYRRNHGSRPPTCACVQHNTCSS